MADAAFFVAGVVLERCNRFDQIVRHTRLDRFHHTRLLGFGRDHDDRNFVILLANLLGNFEATLSGHVPIGEYQVEISRLEQIDRLVAISSFGRLRDSDGLKRPENDFPHGTRIVSN